MPAFLKSLFAHKSFVLGASIASVVMFVGSLLAVPWIVARAPRDFFTRDERKSTGSLPLKVLKNMVGAMLLFAGVLMLLLPGQGILTLVVGLALLDVPGKHALLVRMAKRPSVLKALNYVRQRAKREPFDPP
jgi:hypothetical protein